MCASVQMEIKSNVLVLVVVVAVVSLSLSLLAKLSFSPVISAASFEDFNSLCEGQGVSFSLLCYVVNTSVDCYKGSDCRK